MASRPMSMPEFFKTAEWHQLSVCQKMWVRTYLESGNDRQLATDCSYETSSAENARTFSYQIIRHKKIQAALNRYFNKGRREIFIEKLESDIKASKPESAAYVKLQALYASIIFGAKSQKKQKRRKK
jgi:hypothetical protein